MNKRQLIDLQRVAAFMEFDESFSKNQTLSLCGMDEVGRGPLAGPVVVAAVVFKDFEPITQINDSKKMTQKRREQAFEIIAQRADFSVGIVQNDVVDEINILQATKQAFLKAYKNLGVCAELLLLDYIDIQTPVPNVPIVSGDAKSYCIAAASIVAKVLRDNIMREYHEKYPQYNFEKNKGYGTAEHFAAIKEYGICPIHRKSFLKKYI